MAQTNEINVRGRLGDDPAFKTSKDGKEYCSFKICVNHANDEKSWFNGITFDSETIASLKNLKKGAMCSVNGTFETGKSNNFGINARGAVEALDKDSKQYAHLNVAGNIKDDIELKTSANGKTFCSFSLANNRSYTDKDGQKIDKEAVWFNDITAWGDNAVAMKEAKKGSLWKLDSFINQEKFQGKDGTEKSKYKITVQKVEELTRKQEKKNPEPEMSR